MAPWSAESSWMSRKSASSSTRIARSGVIASASCGASTTSVLILLDVRVTVCSPFGRPGFGAHYVTHGRGWQCKRTTLGSTAPTAGRPLTAGLDYAVWVCYTDALDYVGDHGPE